MARLGAGDFYEFDLNCKPATEASAAVRKTPIWARAPLPLPTSHLPPPTSHFPLLTTSPSTYGRCARHPTCASSASRRTSSSGQSRRSRLGSTPSGSASTRRPSWRTMCRSAPPPPSVGPHPSHHSLSAADVAVASHVQVCTLTLRGTPPLTPCPCAGRHPHHPPWDPTPHTPLPPAADVADVTVAHRGPGRRHLPSVGVAPADPRHDEDRRPALLHGSTPPTLTLTIPGPSLLPQRPPQPSHTTGPSAPSLHSRHHPSAIPQPLTNRLSTPHPTTPGP
jgi:hypothetical protein